MISEEKIRELLAKIQEQKKSSTDEYVKTAKEAEEGRASYNDKLSQLKALSSVEETDEIKEKIEKLSEEANEIAEKYNKTIDVLSGLERTVFSADGVIQACLFILEEDEEEGE